MLSKAEYRTYVLNANDNLHIKKLDMQPDRVLITCEGLGLHHVQVTQASSSHIIIDIVALQRVLSRTFSNSGSDFPCFFVGDSELALGTCPACAGKHRPHTYAEGCKKATTSAIPSAVRSSDIRAVAGTSPHRVLPDSPPANEEHHPGASSSTDQIPPSLEPPPATSPDMNVPRNRLA